MRIQIKIPPAFISDKDFIEKAISKQVDSFKPDSMDWYIARRSIDARSKKPFYVLSVVIGSARPTYEWKVRSLNERPTVHIVGTGPAGYFAALRLIEYGVKPILFDRGKDVRSRRRDLRAIQQFGIVHPDSNYCFGEGGAGTYSDGKLYTRSVKRGRIHDILNLLVEHGAKEDILVDAHPHIGSNKLPQIVSAIRQTIETYGGEVHFDSKVTDLVQRKERIEGLVINDEEEWKVDNLILATGHSARDIYKMFFEKGWQLEFKPFALGVRIEHPQPLIDELQYGKKADKANLPAASYQLTCQISKKGVFSFCMCPGGLIVPAATNPGELVVNGMSLSRRDSPFANSGTVVEISQEDLGKWGYEGILAGLEYQSNVERSFWSAGNGTQQAPAQRLTDFVKDRSSDSLPKSSYIPGIYSAPVHDILPEPISFHLKNAIYVFEKKMRGYLTEEAQIVGVESRTSAPVRIPRDKKTCEHPDVKGLFPCGEGAGFAGGILSAAMDGRNVADKVMDRMDVRKID
ncbi:MAG: FAD-dependent oxidoreductase [Saprospiraceae bacterium]|nr:FAD-dependent oxidoreductase [Saprospiraceae bacterium]